MSMFSKCRDYFELFFQNDIIANMATTTFDDVLDAIEKLDAVKLSSQGKRNQRVRGTAFEYAVRYFLMHDPAWASTFINVWMWGDEGNPLIHGEYEDFPKNDTGIDLVAKDRSGELWAIQCKYYADDRKLDFSDVSTFFASSDTRGIKRGHFIIAHTGGGLTQTLEKEASPRNVVVLDSEQLNNEFVDWSAFLPESHYHNLKKFEPRPYQNEAIQDCIDGFKTDDRGKLIMACGTGKTLTALRLAEELREERDNEYSESKNSPFRVLFLAPSIALVSQTFNYWTHQSKEQISSFVVCSDTTANKRDNDEWDGSVLDVPFPTTTDPRLLADHIKIGEQSTGLSVVFSTYQSIDTIIAAQAQEGLPEFDLVICDEAHRTAGVADNVGVKSAFVKVHDNSLVHAKKRLYMTATPRVYTQAAQTKAVKNDFTTFSMDDEDTFGREFHRLKFGDAVAKGILTDYRVLVLGIAESQGTNFAKRIQETQTFQEQIDSIEQLERRSRAKDKAEKAAQDKLKIRTQAESLSAKVLGAWNGLMTKGIHRQEQQDIDIDTGLGEQVQFAILNDNDVDSHSDLTSSIEHMHTAVAFTRTIHDSKILADGFSDVISEYIQQSEKQGASLEGTIIPKVEHVDGSMPTKERRKLLNWLADRQEDPDGCRILSNAKCLTEGVDLPLLDAVIFFQPRASQVDIVQAVGRVMRKAENKHYGYIILPVVIPDGSTPDAILSTSDFHTVWDILQSLRSHDERLDARINALSLHRKSVKRRYSTRSNQFIDQDSGNDSLLNDQNTGEQGEFDFGGEISEQFQAQLVRKCGDTTYWEDWADSISEIAIKTSNIINEQIRTDKQISQEFDSFLHGLRDTLNPNITKDDAVGMLSQHILTSPIFDALFSHEKDSSGKSFIENNPVSQALMPITELLRPKIKAADPNDDLRQLYSQVRTSAQAVRNDEAARQTLVRNLYESFFRTAFKSDADKLGIVYTPLEIVDYILHLVDNKLPEHFGKHLEDDGVTILDPFTGTGTFIVELIRSGLISPNKLQRKYRSEIFANEIMLLAYYIAMVNIESEYYAVQFDNYSKIKEVGSKDNIQPPVYEPFSGGVLTDTFQMTEDSNSIDESVFTRNSARVVEQNKKPITVIMGNPPYSVGQKSANDNNSNDHYENLDKRIAQTYAANTKAVNKNALYDSYIRAFRWASDRILGRNIRTDTAISGKGIICFVSGGGWLDGTAFDGFRKSLVAEFSDIYVLNLRGNARTSGELRRRENDNVFGAGTRSTVTITLLVCDPEAEHQGVIHYHDIGDYLKRSEKLSTLSDMVKENQTDWKIIIPDSHGDWLNQRDDAFQGFIPLGLKNVHGAAGIFSVYSNGIKTGRDSFSYGFGRQTIENRTKKSIDWYEQNRIFWHSTLNKREIDPKDFVEYDPKVLSWDRELLDRLRRGIKIEYSDKFLVQSMYRPFTKEWLYYDPRLIEMMYRSAILFPLELVSEANSSNLEDDVQECERMYRSASPSLIDDSQFINRCIVTTGVGNSGFSCLMTSALTCLDAIQKGQCFPLYWYEEIDKEKSDLKDELELDFSEASLKNGDVRFTTADGTTFIRHDAITDQTLEVFRQVYPDVSALHSDNVSKAKEQIFYYIYGILHNNEYRQCFTYNLRKELARIPLAKDFSTFQRIGRELAELHINYESLEGYVGEDRISEEWINSSAYESLSSKDPEELYHIDRLTFGKVPKTAENLKGDDRTTVIINNYLVLHGIPDTIYDYKISGKSPIEWVMDQYRVKTDKKSGIKKDPNEWITETKNPRYVVDLLESLVTLTLETQRIVNSLPALEELDKPINWPTSWTK